MENEFPKCLYKLGGDVEWEGRHWSVITVHSGEEEAAADGFHALPSDAIAADAEPQPEPLPSSPEVPAGDKGKGK